MILSAKSTGRLSRLHGSRRGARTRTANGSHDQLVATISLPMAAVPREETTLFATMFTRCAVRFAIDSPLEGAGFEPVVPPLFFYCGSG